MLKVVFFRPSLDGDGVDVPEGLRGRVEAVNLPLHKIVPIPGSARVILEELYKGHDYLAFTSRNGIKALLEEARREGIHQELLGSLSTVKIAAIGERTAEEARSLGLKVHIVPREYTGRALAEVLVKIGVRSVILARSRRGLREIVEILEKGGVKVRDIAVYDLVEHEKLLDHVRRAIEKFNVLVFTSSSIVEAFVTGLERAGLNIESLNNKIIIAIGSTTSSALKRRSINHYTAKRYSLKGIFDVLRRLLEGLE